MYELIRNELLYVQTIESSKQPNGKAVVKSCVETVVGYNIDTPTQIESIPPKEEIAGKTAELHFVEGQLQWKYIDKQPTKDDYISELENQVLLLTDQLTGGIL